MKERKFFRIAGLFMILAAFWVDGMLFLRVQGNSPVSVVTVGDVSAMLMEAGEAGAEDEEGWQLVVEDARPSAVIRWCVCQMIQNRHISGRRFR